MGSEKSTNAGDRLPGDKKERLTKFLRKNADIFAWSHENMSEIDRSVVVHWLNVDLEAKPVRPKKRIVDAARNATTVEEVDKLLKIGFIQELQYFNWLSNVALVKKANEKWKMCIDFTNLNKAYPKANSSLPRIDQVVDAVIGHEPLKFMDAYSGYNQIKMHPTDQRHIGPDLGPG